MTLTVLKISHLEQLNSKIFALLSTIFSRLKIEHLIKQIGINNEQDDYAENFGIIFELVHDKHSRYGRGICTGPSNIGVAGCVVIQGARATHQ
ncbi:MULTISPECIES: hypothetical protein [unclassified Pseudoalteromonas]|uniref:hypothetical protein n=1 Tax=unclassified Pseudoalteromonas TaxID=194690 RepID=UPI002096B7DB|nr:hypothetical protein [Pseudoalteromonas sp. XMcav2-N]MCO7188618.1 hypothetical protein [Pseudoalteromonas sp. XMcav2-N]